MGVRIEIELDGDELSDGFLNEIFEAQRTNTTVTLDFSAITFAVRRFSHGV